MLARPLVAVTSGAVSYTHLDVYKRQRFTLMVSGPCFIHRLRYLT